MLPLSFIGTSIEKVIQKYDELYQENQSDTKIPTENAKIAKTNRQIVQLLQDIKIEYIQGKINTKNDLELHQFLALLTAENADIGSIIDSFRRPAQPIVSEADTRIERQFEQLDSENQYFATNREAAIILFKKILPSLQFLITSYEPNHLHSNQRNIYVYAYKLMALFAPENFSVEDVDKTFKTISDRSKIILHNRGIHDGLQVDLVRLPNKIAIRRFAEWQMSFQDYFVLKAFSLNGEAIEQRIAADCQITLETVRDASRDLTYSDADKV